uniref:Uncharacterized protein n=1 Tax=Malurus cyaneus samueli TaxID=2593467 RepID=A0A8C5TG12_9PASS
MVSCAQVLLEGILQHIRSVSSQILFRGYQLLPGIPSLIYTEQMKKPCIEADLVPTLIPMLESTDQEMLLHAGRAIGRICYDNRNFNFHSHNFQSKSISTNLKYILQHYYHSHLYGLKFCVLLTPNFITYPDSAKEALSMTKVAEQLVKQLRRAESHERLEIVFEVLQALAENDALKVQLVEAGVPEVLSEILLRLHGSSQAQDTCIVKAASDLIVSLLLGDMKRQDKGFLNSQFALLASPTVFLTSLTCWVLPLSSDGNCLRMIQLGIIHQLLDLLEKHVHSGDTSVQQAALSALQNLAVPVVSKVQMLEEGVAERIEALLRSESPPVQSKLLGTLRMLADGQADAAEILGQDPLLLNRLVQWCNVSDHSGLCGEAHRLLASILQHNRSPEVVKAIQAAQGVKHLVSMTTSEHAVMQNEALNALAIASAIDLGIFLLKESQLVQSLHRLLKDDNTSPEVKYNSMGLLCRLLNSGNSLYHAHSRHVFVSKAEAETKQPFQQCCLHTVTFSKAHEGHDFSSTP